MDKSQFEKIIIHQVKMILKEKNLKITDLNNYEILTYKYDVALMLLCELGVKNER